MPTLQRFGFYGSICAEVFLHLIPYSLVQWRETWMAIFWRKPYVKPAAQWSLHSPPLMWLVAGNFLCFFPPTFPEWRFANNWHFAEVKPCHRWQCVEEKLCFCSQTQQRAKQCFLLPLISPHRCFGVLLLSPGSCVRCHDSVINTSLSCVCGQGNINVSTYRLGVDGAKYYNILKLYHMITNRFLGSVIDWLIDILY